MLSLYLTLARAVVVVVVAVGLVHLKYENNDNLEQQNKG
jgi:hypothetical protein